MTSPVSYFPFTLIGSVFLCKNGHVSCIVPSLFFRDKKGGDLRVVIWIINKKEFTISVFFFIFLGTEKLRPSCVTVKSPHAAAAAKYFFVCV